MVEPHLVLASASPRRRALLAELGLPFSVRAVDIDEEHALATAPSQSPLDLAMRVAAAKAEASVRHANEVVLTADTLVMLDGRPLGKPRDACEAKQMLEALRGREHVVVTGVAVVAAAERFVEATEATVTMREYAADEISRYIERGEPFDKAGAYAIQDTVFAPVASYRGCYCTIVGLPLWCTRRLLRSVGLRPEAPTRAVCRACPDREEGG
ncbi:MAG TPA: Maf family protein [Dehalococcoidia bacterium]|nr:Maf family protein [Dehalococcoidia bacterium]